MIGHIMRTLIASTRRHGATQIGETASNAVVGMCTVRIGRNEYMLTLTKLRELPIDDDRGKVLHLPTLHTAPSVRRADEC